MADTIICEKTGWTYEQLNDTPQWFIDTMMMRWRAESEHNKREQRRSEMRSKMRH